MATTSIWAVKGRLKAVVLYAANPKKTEGWAEREEPGARGGEEAGVRDEAKGLSDVITYAVREEKTRKKSGGETGKEACSGEIADEGEGLRERYVSGVNCAPATAWDEMTAVKKRYGKEDGILAFHGYQSFAPGECTPKTAHEIGVKLADELWGSRFQVVVATHLDKAHHLHNHFVVNSVSFLDGKRYHRTKQDYRDMRGASDRLCRAYALSVIWHPEGKKKPYALYQAERSGRPTRENVARQAVDEAIRGSFTRRDFERRMLQMGYRVNLDPNRKYGTILGEGWGRPKRLYRLGEDYTKERILTRIGENSYSVRFSCLSKGKEPVRKVRVKGTLKHAKRIGGFRGLYLHYCYRLGILPRGRKQNPARVSPLLKDDLIKTEAIIQETRLLCRHRIDTAGQLLSYRDSLETEKQELAEERKWLYAGKRQAGGREENGRSERLFQIAERMKAIRTDLRLCEGILARSGVLKETLRAVSAEEKSRKEEERKHEYRRGSGRADRPDESGRG